MTREKLILLQDAQQKKSGIDAIISEAKAVFEKAIEGNILRQKELATEIDGLKAELTTEAKADYIADPDSKKTRDGGIKIQTSTAVSYDAAKALAYAKDKDMFLALDKKAFEAVATKLSLDFVISTPTVKVTFPGKGIVLEDN